MFWKIIKMINDGIGQAIQAFLDGFKEGFT